MNTEANDLVSAFKADQKENNVVAIQLQRRISNGDKFTCRGWVRNVIGGSGDYKGKAIYALVGNVNDEEGLTTLSCVQSDVIQAYKPGLVLILQGEDKTSTDAKGREWTNQRVSFQVAVKALEKQAVES